MTASTHGNYKYEPLLFDNTENYKGAVIVPDISDWVLCHTLGDLNCAVVISPPNMREGENDVLCNG